MTGVRKIAAPVILRTSRLNGTKPSKAVCAVPGLKGLKLSPTGIEDDSTIH
jgi:hypothetical protein